MTKKNTSAHSDFIKFADNLEKKVNKGGKDVDPINFKTLGEISEFIDSGNYLLNAQLSGTLFGGYPNTRGIELAGESGSGKTFLAMNAVRGAQALGYFVFFVDTEGALEKVDFERFGVDLTMCRHVRTIKSYAQVLFFVNKLIETKKESDADNNTGEMKVMLIIDSYAHLLTQKEIEDAAKGKDASDMGLRAKQGRQFFRNITLDMSNLKIPFLFTNHTSAKIDLFGGENISGGGGPTYAASIILKLAKSALRDGERNKLGIIVKSLTEKNRLAAPIQIHFHISFTKGMNRFVGLEEYVSWENCGVQRGRIVTKDEYDKLTKGESKSAKDWKKRRAEPYTIGDKEYVAILYDSAQTIAVKMAAESVDPKYFFTSKVFTDETLRLLDENVIQPTFKYKDIATLMEEELDELKSLTNDSVPEIEAVEVDDTEDLLDLKS